ncbi:carboxylesterase/lipase family protein [Nonomuraea basaltis]|uniref:carboxylesterase/lipase family protein n=1 Tax=Nonomuraea basaltis TaxID=2495887 RepID=UPI00110C6F56|nr:carboxylesterase family protein [Nonomuraea basaltis]TMR94071.1 carboxylesterase family protein [Nonomuraea basaltis]
MRRRSIALLAGVSAAAVVAASLPAMAGLVAGAPESAYPGQYPVVRTDDGLLRGEAKSMVTSFKGIPYAAPPVDGLRWKAPQPAAKWRGVRDATQFGGSCVQGIGWDPGYEQPTLTEDCLYLNVYRPTDTKEKDLPVFVWNHGGGNVGGAGRDTNPDKFVTRQDVVYVTINYRLGAMGYLLTSALEQDNPDSAAGNFGILDQQAALRWVQKNIGSFGGDPDNVTLAGQSAGAGNTAAQLAAPGGRGLFHRAILQSGGGGAARTPAAARTSGEQFAAELGCVPGAGQASCLRAKSPAQVLAAQIKYRQSGAVAGTAVLPDDPLALLKAGKLTRLPVVVGGTSDESQQSVFGAYDYLGKPLTKDQLDSLIATTYPNGADKVRTAYPAANYKSPTVTWGAIQSDQRACRDQTLRDRLAANTKTWTYEFAEKNDPPFVSIWRLNTDYPFGATHVNDLGYLWDYLGTALPFSTAQVDLSNQMISYWGAFARNGDPNVKAAPAWARYTPQGTELQFAAPSAKQVPHTQIDTEHNCALWDQVSPAP